MPRTYIPTGRPRGRPRKDGLPPQSRIPIQTIPQNETMGGTLGGGKEEEGLSREKTLPTNQTPIQTVNDDTSTLPDNTLPSIRDQEEELLSLKPQEERWKCVLSHADRLAHGTKKTLLRFLDCLAQTCNVKESCRQVGITVAGVYYWRNNLPVFAQAWEEAITTAVEGLEGEMYRRAVQGYDTSIVSKGQVIGQEKRYSDQLAVVLAKAHRPEKFGDRQQINVRGVSVVYHVDGIIRQSPETEGEVME